MTKTFTKVKPWKATKNYKNVLGALTQSTYKGDWDDLPNFSTITPEKTRNVSGVDAIDLEFVALVFDGYLYINATNMIEFALASDDGSRLLIDDEVVVDNDGLHGTQEKRGSAPLSRGWHKISVEWFNKTGGADLSLRMGVLGEDLHVIDPNSFSTSK